MQSFATIFVVTYQESTVLDYIKQTLRPLHIISVSFVINQILRIPVNQAAKRRQDKRLAKDVRIS